MTFKKIALNTIYFLISCIALVIFLAFAGFLCKLIWKLFLFGWGVI